MSGAALMDPETLAMLRDGLTRFQQESYGFQDRQSRMDGNSRYSRRAWREYASLGWLAMAVPSDLGGFDGDPNAIGALMEYVGSSLAMEPVLANATCARVLARCRGARADGWLSEIASGGAIFALAHGESPGDGVFGTVAASCRDGRITGTKTVVLHGDVAEKLLVTARDASGMLVLCGVDPRGGGTQASHYPLVDGRGAASFEFSGANAEVVPIEGSVDSVIDAALDECRVALCGEALGAIQSLNAATLEHLKTRKQFGRPIGANQVLQHRMVDLYVLEEETRAVVDAARRALSEPGIDAVRAVSAAAAHTASASRQTAHEAVQMHGGMGITDELPVSHYFKRLMVTARLLGDRDQHVARFATASPA